MPHFESSNFRDAFATPPADARPWVYWYWMHAAVSREGIKADLESFAQIGLRGAYLMPIGGVQDPPLFEPPASQLTPHWWSLVRYAFEEADRLGLKLALHICDGFALAGGPWITPENSMQKVVWNQFSLEGGQRYDQILELPPHNEGYYRDIALFAFPTPAHSDFSTRTQKPKIRTSDGQDASFLTEEGHGQTYRNIGSGWIEYEFAEPFLCRSIRTQRNGNNLQANRLRVEASDDGEVFHFVAQLEPPRHGWQDTDAEVTHAIEPTRARYFRFSFDPAGSEPGAEDLDSGKWMAVFKICGLELSSTPKIHQFEGKIGEVWRVGKLTSAAQLPDELCLKPEEILDLSSFLDSEGRLQWQAPAGQWTLVRIGHTSTGHRNETAGAGRGLECDKFSPEAAKIQFEGWFGEAIRQVGPELAARVLSIFHIDSWECGSQNWSPYLPAEFAERRGHDLLGDYKNFLLCLAGIAVESAETSERFLSDFRATLAETVRDNFYGTLHELAHQHGTVFSAESVAPTFTSDGMAHFKIVDVPMGEFWLNSPTHDKPADIRDAISGAHVYGKNIVQAEAFTQLRIGWDEYPAQLKSLGDRHFALGINRFVFHVCAHNPWLDHSPGMTLNGVGLFFGREQIWWSAANGWTDYLTRCQAVLQTGAFVADIAVFTGEETPRRSILPEQLSGCLPGLLGSEALEREARRLKNSGQPMQEQPAGVNCSANITNPQDWLDPLRGYAYDSLNAEALLERATVQNGRVELAGGASYAVLVIPAERPLAPENRMSLGVATKIFDLLEAGATVLWQQRPQSTTGLEGHDELQNLLDSFWPQSGETSRQVGQGRLLVGAFEGDSLAELGIDRDFWAHDLSNGQYPAPDIAWTHRRSEDGEIYFLSNQQAKERKIEVSLRCTGGHPEIWDAVSGQQRPTLKCWHEEKRTILPLHLATNEAVFIFVPHEKAASEKLVSAANWCEFHPVLSLDGLWEVAFDPKRGGPETPLQFKTLKSWTERSNVRFYSGSAIYRKNFEWNGQMGRFWLDVGQIANLGKVRLNGRDLGTIWTAPMRVEISEALKKGDNHLEIEVFNTWANALIGDSKRPDDERKFWMNAPFRLGGQPLRQAGLLGPVQIVEEVAESI